MEHLQDNSDADQPSLKKIFPRRQKYFFSDSRESSKLGSKLDTEDNESKNLSWKTFDDEAEYMPSKSLSSLTLANSFTSMESSESTVSQEVNDVVDEGCTKIVPVRETL